MQIINYPQYSYEIERKFGCFIHGKIVVTKSEWQSIIKYLQSAKVKKSFLPSYPWTNTVLKEDLQRSITVKKGTIYNIRVPMTEKAVEKFAPNNNKLKKANYIFLVLK